MLSDFSALLLAIYGLSHSRAVDEFQDAALALIKPVVPFDSGKWGSGTLSAAGVDEHHLHLHRMSNEMLQAYDENKAQDAAAFSVGQHRSATGAFHVPEVFAGNSAMLDYARRFGHHNLFISADTEPDTGYTQYLSLYRADVHAHCQESERQWLQHLRPHLMQALAMNRKLHLDRWAGSAATAGSAVAAAAAPGLRCGLAVADLRGRLHHADADFNTLLRHEWPGWQPGPLPAALVRHFSRGEGLYQGAGLVVQHQLKHQLLFLRARPRCKADTLSAREHEVALLIAQGHSHKTAAQQLRRAPATVRNHIQAIYAKLEVSNVAGLVAAMRQAGWA
jgi:DNA-binding CsgD family transcriptional regulator